MALGKGYTGKTCAYCCEPGSSSTRDHVIPRKFLPEHLRADLPTVPACAACNTAKSQDEHYLASVLPFGSEHPHSRTMLVRNVPRRLKNNDRLRQELAAGQKPFQLNEGGMTHSVSSFDIEPERITRFAKSMIRGLHAVYWEPIRKEMWVGAGILTKHGQMLHGQLMASEGDKIPRTEIGDGLFTWEAVRSRDPPHSSVWRLRLFGGVAFHDPEHSGFVTRDIFGLVAADSVPAMFGD